jgi:putative transposase
MKDEFQIYSGIDLEITKRSQQQFEVIPRRWVVERTIAWVNRYRRLSKDYEYRTTSESMIYMAGIKIMLRRIAKHGITL